MKLLMKTKYEDSLFTEALGNSPTIRVLDILLIFKPWDYSMTDLEEAAGVGWTTLHEIIPRLLKKGILKHTRCIGRAKMYAINEENPYAQMLIQFYDKLAADHLKLVEEKYSVNAKVK